MKSKRNLVMAIMSLALFSWLAACSSSGMAMDNSMDSGMHSTKDAKMTNKSMDSGMDSTKDSKMMNKSMVSGMDSTKDSTAMDKPMDSGMDTAMATRMTGMFTGSGGHQAAGTATLAEGTMGKYVLTLSALDVEKVPDGYIYLTNDGDRMHGLELGRLNQFSGSVSFALPSGTHPAEYNSVVIWCKKFKVEIGRADLAKATM